MAKEPAQTSEAAPAVAPAAQGTNGSGTPALEAAATAAESTPKGDTAPAATAKPESTESTKSAPSLLATADVGARDGAPEGEKPKGTETKAPTEKPPTEAAKPGEVKPAEGKVEAKAEIKPAEGEAKPGEAKPPQATKDALAEQPPAPPVYGALKLPENVKLDPERVAKFDGIFGELETTTKADHAQIEGQRQKLADMFVEEVQRISEQAAKHQVDVWNRINEQRINELKADPDLGGNRINTTLGNAKYALESMMGLNKQEAGELLAIMDAGGVSNSRLMVKALHNLYERLREGEPVHSNLPTLPGGRGQRNWYDKTDGASA